MSGTPTKNHHRRAALLAPLTTAAAAIAAAVVVFAVDPNEPGHYPTCPVFATTSLYCTGCGTLRAVHALLHLDPATAVGMNPLTVLLVPVVLASWGAWVRRAWTGRARTWLAPPWVLVTGLVVGVAFTVLRNVPALAPWLAPGV